MSESYRYSCVIMLCLVTLARAQSAAELDSYNAVIADINGGNATKALTDLDSWKQKVPDSSYNNERLTLYVQAYAATNQPAKVLEAARSLLSKDLHELFKGPTAQATIIRLLYSTTWAISQSANPTPDELAMGGKAARQLLAYDEPLPGLTPEKWAEVRADMKEKAEAALFHIAMLPGVQAMARRPPDCAAAEAAYTAALAAYPDKAALAYELGRALNCEAKLPAAIYEFERAAALDATLGDARNDPKKIQAVGDNAYIKLHGSDEGLKDLQQLAKQSPLPPAGLTIKTREEIADEKQAQLERTNPQLALWLRVKNQLTNADGEQYFESQMKGSAFPQLSGTLMEALPACRPNELLVAIPVPDSPLHTELRLRLDKALTGNPERNAPLHWEGVPTAFTRDPFLLTMDVEKAKLQGLTVTPCRRP
jgi:hypothetical protein